MLKFVYLAIFEDNGDGSFTVKFPDLLGCITYGENAADALIMAQDAACGRILGELEDGKQIPNPCKYKDIVLSDSETISLMALDIDAYSAQYGRLFMPAESCRLVFILSSFLSLNPSLY